MIKSYVQLTKPGIIFGNAITAAGGAALASRGQIDGWLLFAVLLGLSFIVGSACVFNNYIDREADRKMHRTKNRALAKGEITPSKALAFAVALGLSGIFVLWQYTNPLALCAALIGVFVYVVLYTFSKYRTLYGTHIGSIAGAMPPVVGYCAVTGQCDTGALILFLIVAFWQMPHFFAIAMFRAPEYAAASIPVLPLQKGMHAAKVHSLAYILCFLAAAPLLTLCGLTGNLYLITSLLLGTAWLVLALKGFKAPDDTRWARQMFAFSILAITALSLAMALDVN